MGNANVGSILYLPTHENAAQAFSFFYSHLVIVNSIGVDLMEEKKTSVFSNGLIWFGAAVSIAEILTGTLFAPLGFVKGISAVLLGHFIGCVLLFFAGLIGAQTKKSAMDTVKLSFGQKGAVLFSSLNVLQLVGWTAVMIASGAAAASSVISLGSSAMWCIVIGALIIVWLLIGISNLGKINTIAMGALFVLSIVLSVLVFKNGFQNTFEASLSFGAAVELAVAMPLSWLPLISDYTRSAQKPFAASLASSAVYFVVSSWMYVIGMGAAMFTSAGDISGIMLKAGLGAAGLIIIIFSTVTTTFLDVYSAGVSAVSITDRIKEKPAAIAVCIVGIFLAVFTSTARFEDFLYLIGSLFAPMIAVQMTDYFILKKDVSHSKADLGNLLIWAAGFALYRIFMHIDTPVGNTLPVMLITGIVCFIADKIKKGAKKNV